MGTGRTLLLFVLLLALVGSALSDASCRSSPVAQTNTSTSVTAATETSDPYLTEEEVANLAEHLTTSTSPVSPSVADGEWWLQADRQSRVDDVGAQDELLPESAYQPVDEVDLTFRVVISGGGTEVFFETYDSNYQVRGTGPSIVDDRIWYDTDTPWGGRFVIWQTADGLQAEETMYGEGHSILHSYRGKLVEAQPET